MRKNSHIRHFWVRRHFTVGNGGASLTIDGADQASAIAINEHEQPLREFCSEDYDARDKFRAKIVPDIVNAA